MALGKPRFVLCTLGLLAVASCGPQSSGGDEGSPSSSSGGVVPDESGTIPVTQHGLNQVLSTGQSLSVGMDGGDAISTSQPYSNLMFKSGVIAGGAPPRELVPLVEGKASNPSHPNTETMSSGLANFVSKLARDNGQEHDVLVSVHGVSHYVYDQLKKGTAPYGSGIAQARAGHEAALAMGKDHVVRVVTVVHGESDDHDHNPSYQADIRQWQADYEADIRAVTGQSEPVPMLHTQLSSFVKTNMTSSIPIAQLAEHVASNGKTVLVGPKYHLPYAVDGVHLTNDGYRRMGEEYAKVYKKIILDGQKWEPLRPQTITRSGNVVTVKFVVPSPPLVLDESSVRNPGGYGFEVAQASGTPPRIQSVRVTGSDTVEITLSSAPTGSARLRYAYTASTIGVSAGPITGPRGNLRDSDSTQSRSGGKPLWNWCVHFDEAMP